MAVSRKPAALPIEISGTPDQYGRLEERLQPPIHLPQGGSVALVSGTVWRTWYNISESLGNNRLDFTSDASTTTETLTIPNGLYVLQSGVAGLKDLNAVIGELLKGAGVSETGITLTPDYSRGRVEITLESQYGVDFTSPGNIGIAKVLGFQAQTLLNTSPAAISVYGKSPPRVQRTEKVVIRSNLVNGTIFRGRASNILFSSPVNVLPGSQLSILPPQLIHAPVSGGTYNCLEIQIADENGDGLDLNGENISLLLSLNVF